MAAPPAAPHPPEGGPSPSPRSGSAPKDRDPSDELHTKMADFAKDSDVRAWLSAQGLQPPPAKGLPANYTPEIDYPSGKLTPELTAPELRWNDALVRVLWSRHLVHSLGSTTPHPSDLLGIDKTTCLFWCHPCGRVKTLRRSRNIVKDVDNKYTADALKNLDDAEERERMRKALDDTPLDQRDLELNTKTGGQWYLMCGTNFREEGRPRACRKWEPAHAALSKWPGWSLLTRAGNRALPIIDKALGFRISAGGMDDERLVDEFLSEPDGRSKFGARMVPPDKKLFEAVLALDAQGYDFTTKLLEASLTMAKAGVSGSSINAHAGADTGGPPKHEDGVSGGFGVPPSKRGRVGGA